MTNLTSTQIHAIRCAYLDLWGSLQASRQGSLQHHDWEAHEESINDLEEAFPDLVLGLVERVDDDLDYEPEGDK